MSRRKKKKNGTLIIIIVVVAFAVLVMSIQTGKLNKEYDLLVQERMILEEKVEEEKDREKDLQDLEKYMKTKKYMEEVAKEKLGLVYPNEILIKPEED